MIFSNKQLNFLLKTALLVNTFGWGLSILGLILPSENAFKWLVYMGCHAQYDPKLDYWLRMTAFVFTWIAFLSIKAFINPKKSKELILHLGILNTIGGFILIIAGVRLNIPINEFIPDALFCLSTGPVMLLCSRIYSNR